MKGIFPTWPTLSGPQSHLVTANLTSLFSLYWEGLNLMHLPSFQEEEGSGRSGHHESLAKSPSGPSSPSVRSRLTYSAKDGGPSASQPCQPLSWRMKRQCLFFCSWTREKEREFSHRIIHCALTPPCVLFRSELQCGTNLSKLQAHLSLGVTSAV